MLQSGNGAGVIDAPSWPVPVDIVIEISGDDAWPLFEEVPVFGERTSHRAQLVLPAHAAAAVLRPHGQKIALDGACNANRRNVSEGCLERLTA